MSTASREVCGPLRPLKRHLGVASVAGHGAEYRSAAGGEVGLKRRVFNRSDGGTPSLYSVAQKVRRLQRKHHLFVTRLDVSVVKKTSGVREAAESEIPVSRGDRVQSHSMNGRRMGVRGN